MKTAREGVRSGYFDMAFLNLLHIHHSSSQQLRSVVGKPIDRGPDAFNMSLLRLGMLPRGENDKDV